MQNAIILLSGGLDSATTAYYVKSKVKPKNIVSIFFDYGQRTTKEEEYCSRIISKNIGAKFKKINLKWLGEISTALLNNPKKNLPKIIDKDLTNIKKEKNAVINYWVPCRNSIFLLAALAHAESEFISKKQKYDIYIGLKCEGQIPMKDTTQDFVNQINKLSKFATHDGNYKVLAPLIKEDKDDIVLLGSKLRVPYQFTYSCFAGTKKFVKDIPVHCGTCASCVLRKKAFYWANVKDPSIYNN